MQRNAKNAKEYKEIQENAKEYKDVINLKTVFIKVKYEFSLLNITSQKIIRQHIRIDIKHIFH